MPRKKKQTQKANRRLGKQASGQSLAFYCKVIVCLLVLAGLIALGEYLWVSFSHQPIRHVAITSDGHEVQVAKLQPLVKKDVTGDFYTLNTHQLQSHLLLLPWVKSASIRRVWPDRLTVSIHEHKAVALWNETQLLSAEGTLFQPPLATYPVGLPRLAGAKNTEKEVLSEYAIISEKLYPLGLKVVALELVVHYWKFRLDSGAQVYFNEGEEQQLKGFNKLYQQVLHKNMGLVERVDLRYAGGAAVRWKTHIKKKR
jgi:cell division protein FtsQ